MSRVKVGDTHPNEGAGYFGDQKISPHLGRQGTEGVMFVVIAVCYHCYVCCKLLLSVLCLL